MTGLRPTDASLLHIGNLMIEIHYLDVSYTALYTAICKTSLYVRLDLICSFPDQLGLQEEAYSHFTSMYKHFLEDVFLLYGDTQSSLLFYPPIFPFSRCLSSYLSSEALEA